jgi:hypothetical protein
LKPIQALDLTNSLAINKDVVLEEVFEGNFEGNFGGNLGGNFEGGFEDNFGFYDIDNYLSFN